MDLVHTIGEARRRLDDARNAGGTVGLVPTMGYLHDGHVSLMTAAVAECDLVMTTIFVNPLQFSPDEDLDDYPRDLERDAERCRDAGVSLLLHPSVDEMYPQPVATQVVLPDLMGVLDGVSRPSHFQGVATVVAKLFNIGGACRAYFGEKDWQQLQIVTRMAADLSFPVTVVGCPIVREADGVAMSSRNVYLDGPHRVGARALSRALRAGVDLVASGCLEAAPVQAAMARVIETEPLAVLDYASVVDGRSLEPVTTVTDRTRLLVAARVGPARLIDNTDAFHPGTLP